MELLNVPPIKDLQDSDYGWMYGGMEAVASASWEEMFGDSDESYKAQGLRAMRAAESDYEHQWVIAVRDDSHGVDSVVGYAMADMPRNDNLSNAEVALWVHPNYRKQGIGSQLLTWAESVVASARRTQMIVFGFFGEYEDVPPRISAAAGGQAPRNSSAVSFFTHRGFELAQIEKRSALDLPLDPGLASTLLASTVDFTSGYRTHTWFSTIPKEWVEPLAQLRRVFSTDAPSGEIDVEEEQWDAERVRRTLAEELDMGFEVLTTVAEHIETGELAGCAQLLWRGGDPLTHSAEQWITIVTKAHRGHRLGMWMKLINLEAMMTHRPDMLRVTTSNAHENAHMLAINIDMGFQPSGGIPILTKTV